MIALIIETRGNTTPSVGLELMALAMRLKKNTGLEILALVFGEGAEQGARWFANETGEHTLGVEGVTNELTGMEMGDVLGEVLKNRGLRYLLLPHTPSAMEIAPALAVDLGFSLIPGVVEFDAAQAIFYRSVGGGTSCLQVKYPQAAVITLQPGTFTPPPQAPGSGPVALITVHPSRGPARILSTHAQPLGASRLSGARVVVSAGRGIGAMDALPLLSRFANAIPGSATGCSRPLVDMGWMPYSCQVGITGTSVSADLYIALGISGSSQHLAGIPRATTVISINRDPNAAICAISDLIFETDLLPFMEATLALLENRP